MCTVWICVSGAADSVSGQKRLHRRLFCRGLYFGMSLCYALPFLVARCSWGGGLGADDLMSFGCGTLPKLGTSCRPLAQIFFFGGGGRSIFSTCPGSTPGLLTHTHHPLSPSEKSLSYPVSCESNFTSPQCSITRSEK